MEGITTLGRLELVVVLALGVANVAAETVVRAKTPLVLIGVVAWALLIAAHVRADPAVVRRWGLRVDNLRQAAVPAASVVGPLLVAFALWGARVGTFPPPRGFIVVILLYPVWGVAQQFLLQAILFSNLSARMPRAAAQPLAALLFSLSHAPDLPLMVLTLPAGLLFTEHYRRWPNLWVLGISQGLLGGFVYYFLLGRDPSALLLR